jgi:SagB-type dehydrogenase family enzyme
VAAAVIASLPLALMTMTHAVDDSASLPPLRLASSVSIKEALTSRRSVRAFATAGVSLDEAAQLLWAAQGITDAEGLRTAPSAGALSPLEIYFLAGIVASFPAGICRYEPKLHPLARTISGDQRRELTLAARHQAWIADAPAVVVIAAMYRRTRAKYGDRAERYVHIEAGHAAENICLQAVALGLGTTIVEAFADAEVKRLLGLDEEESILLIPVGRLG